MATKIETENLEAHVELCDVRYGILKEKLDSVDSKTAGFEGMLMEIQSMIREKDASFNKQMFRWSLSIIGFLATVIATLAYMILKKEV